jgi:MFS family permease
VVNVLFTLIAIWKIDQLGRRALLMAGCTGMMVSHIVIGTLFYTGHSDGMLLMVFVLCFTASFSFSYGPVVWTLLSEIFPTSIRGRAMSIATLSIWVGTYLVGQLVPWLFENITTQGTFWLFAGMCIPAILIVWKLVRIPLTFFSAVACQERNRQRSQANRVQCIPAVHVFCSRGSYFVLLPHE